MEEKYPPLIDRYQSTVIDLVLMLVLVCTFVSVTERYENIPTWIKILLIVLLVAYEPISMKLGCTLGNFLKGIRVRKFSNTTKRINFLQAFIRYPIKLMLGWVSFLTIHSNPKRRAIHDLASGSVMIKL